MNRKIFILSIAGVSVFAVAMAQSNAGLALKVNGKSVAGKTIVSGGETYVPLSALKASGATTSIANKTLSLNWSTGGSGQAVAVEGGLGEWLFNGVWRFRVTSVKANNDRPGWILEAEIRNGTRQNGLSLAGTGFDSIDLVMKDGNTLGVLNITELRDPPIDQAAGIKLGLIYYDDEGNGRKPDKLILRIKPDEFTKKFMKDAGVSYSSADPSFRINLGFKD